MTVTLEEATLQLENLVKEAARGEEIVIMDGDLALAKLVAVESPSRPARRLGSAHGSVWVAPNFEAPLEDLKDYM